ncbi:ABC transporter ATP-binding protein [Tessaracoccus sp. MC1865]|uniref:ABC transporter ATP-binding protein n=1 Tax=unclassified Tessaracoccus TaxID=2635419 RepID=UPI00096D97DC|nr:MULTISPECIES: ABC transporter ATP-binding protein [unclassified Tessaracoccus]MBB1483712.1 ABC transporter ATP-binding protein [Tessaracoccus sp. MC1865]MCG6566047.1 ABC transporter ATP-binding protein [Tessaracoccus sp. ZS01]OMG58558.1 ABC transporter ATP-binding protein [Tessaracoccus sp. ZS01]QTO36781.1 ABC transporter ATP-binding protein [Tessaracoccus sp. MC1865]
MLELASVTKRFFPGTVNERVALDAINLTLHEGDFVTVIGSNGAGKSTMLNVVSGRYPVDGGTVTIDGKNVSRTPEHQRAKWVARVFQDPMAGTSPHLTIEENLAIAFERGRKRGLRMAVTSPKRAVFKEALTTLELGLENRLDMRVGMLSGGQRQALSLLMATYAQPAILLLDEHTAALDPARAALITRLTGEAVERHRLTTLMVTHNMHQAIELGNRLIMMHEGRIVLEVDDEAKKSITAEQLTQEFAKIKGASLSDRTLLD